MKGKIRYLLFLTCASLFASTVAADDHGRQDNKALDVLKSMSTYTESLDQVVISGVSFTDARLDGGLMVSNTTEVKISIDRPGSLRISSFDGAQKMEIFFHDGTLTVFNTQNKFYAQADIPNEIEAALEFALEELDVEAPLMDLIYADVSTHLIGSMETVLYLTDQARVGGSDCHHIAIRGPESDVQIWVEEGDRPVPRKIMITSKWEGGSPRYTANMNWVTDPKIDQETFEFKAPEGSQNIGFALSAKQEGK
jgi:hypothetical protein